ncbi:hypothetical protein Q4566_05320 [Tamlana sp. 2_MG-2023]|uniref:hypothetical protein n=1 Tax=unclassified Tamlana TaxID=2614803 RepID=UPI0026E3DCC4|nr:MULTISPECIES: hypothetical protein [unclassified Tamlana]MDO6759614.1 hypothetical protein [Tamlana sp. 2_MG-2023]MDO6792159.1 hypothetical protein [Tamlana sp. 1_MG-2023]
MKFEPTNTKTDKIKWLIYIVIGFCALIYIIKYSEWNFFFKFLTSFLLIINLLFDIYYLTKIKPFITNIELNESFLTINRINNKSKKTQLSNLRYSIRKQKFDKQKTEIEIKEKKGFKFKTIERLHIKNWNEIFEIEQELENHKIPRVEWKPQTIWKKYWGIFIDLFFLTVGDGDIGMYDYQERLNKESNRNKIKNNNA